MTENTLHLRFVSNGQEFQMGAGEEIDITEISGLESSEISLVSTETSLSDGSYIEARRIKDRPISIRARYRTCQNNPGRRSAIIRFFNPKNAGELYVTLMGVKRKICYEIEGWKFVRQKNLDQRLGIILDLICPDPYFWGLSNFGKNMASKTALFSFPWRSLPQKATGIIAYPERARGFLLGGTTMGYRTLREYVNLVNDGDCETGLKIVFIAEKGPVKNPKITHRTSGKYMRVVVDMKKGDQLVIDTNRRHQVIELNGQNIYHLVDRLSSPFQLSVGDNFLKYAADENQNNLEVNLYFTSRYMGV